MCKYIYVKGEKKGRQCEIEPKGDTEYCSQHKKWEGKEVNENAKKLDISNKKTLYWTEINSDIFKYQLYHHQYKEFAWSVDSINDTKNIMKGWVKKSDIIYSVYDINGNRKKVASYRLIYYALHMDKVTCCANILCKNPEPSIFNPFESNHDIDHIDGDHTNNNINNLQRLCHSCHSKKTHIQTKENRKSHGLSKSIKIVAFKEDDAMYREEFNSIEDAKLKLGVSKISKNIFDFENTGIINWIGGLKHSNYYRFEKIIEHIDGEIWKKIPEKNCEISNKGRVKNSSGISFGQISKHGYYIFHIGKKEYQVHNILLRTFKFEELKKKHNK